MRTIILIIGLIMLASQSFAYNIKTGLSSIDRENGKLGPDAIAWIQEHEPDAKKGKINFHYWWKINDEYYAIHKDNFRQHWSTKDGIKNYITKTLGDMIKRDQDKIKKDIFHVYNKIVALDSLGMSIDMMKLFLKEHKGIVLDQAMLVYINKRNK